ncbi:MAG: hypothetical protein V2A73_19020, partial [Pseudomonadota bacterium]
DFDFVDFFVTIFDFVFGFVFDFVFVAVFVSVLALALALALAFAAAFFAMTSRVWPAAVAVWLVAALASTSAASRIRRVPPWKSRNQARV